MSNSKQSMSDTFDARTASRATIHDARNVGEVETRPSAASDIDWFDADGNLVAGDLVVAIEDGDDEIGD